MAARITCHRPRQQVIQQPSSSNQITYLSRVTLNSDIKLARVCGVPLGGATRETDTAHSTQHRTQAGMRGLFGTF